MGDGEEGIAAYVEPFVILLILFINGVVAIWQDSGADNALEKLKEMQAQESQTLRDGQWQTIDAVQLVPGDIVKVKAGECVPADCRLAEILSISLQLEQAALTGESVSVTKNIETLGADANMLQDQTNMLFSSTIVSTGNAVAIVAYTGMNTAIGSVHAEVQAAKEDEEDTPLKQKIDQFGDLLAKIIAIICLVVWVINYNHFSDPIHGGFVKGCIYYFKIAVALAVAAIPEGLPAVITTCLALGTRKMSDNNCIVRRLPSVETLGCTSTICSDKTGTLTKNEMSAIRFGLIGSQPSEVHEYDVEESSYSPEGSIQGGFSQNEFSKRANAKYMALVCSINNRATIDFRDKGYKILGEPTEGALKVLAEKFGRYDPRTASAPADKESPMRYASYLNDTFTHVATLDFSSERKTMSTVISDLDGKQGNQVLLKGAPERVIERCDKVMLMDGSEVDFTADLKDQMNKKVLKVASQGFRVLGVGISLDGGNMKHITKANRNTELADSKQYAQFENGNSFLGYVCIKDPVRPEAKAAIRECKMAGINVIMITGDSKETAISIAQELDII